LRPGSKQLIYEVNLELDPGIQDEYDQWLEDHVGEMLALPGFLSADISVVAPDAERPDDRPRRCVRYVVASREALDDYFRDQAPRMRALGAEKFGDRFQATRRVIEHRTQVRSEDAYAESPLCPNCDTPLSGQYCWQCGQRSRVRLITLWELLSDAIGDLFELDSRLWRSIVPLLFRPGQLTSDYLAGRRARYMPPFRMYLVLSILFFLVWNVNSDDFNIGADIDSESPGHGELAAVGVINDRLAELEKLQLENPNPERQESIDHLGETLARLDSISTDRQTLLVFGGGVVDPGPDSDEIDAFSGASPYGEEPEQASDSSMDALNDVSPVITDEGAAESTKNSDDWHCDEIEYDVGWDWLNQRIGADRIKAACRKMEKDRGNSFGKAILNNLPAMMFIFLPLLALALKVFYLGSGRYYVEHLLFTVHYHAFFFLIVTITILVHSFQEFFYLPDWLVGIFTAVVVFYIQPVYLYKALRRVYEQGHIVTSIKWMLLSITYVAALTATMLATVVYTALTL
jgi:hypothetical protein